MCGCFSLLLPLLVMFFVSVVWFTCVREAFFLLECERNVCMFLAMLLSCVCLIHTACVSRLIWIKQFMCQSQRFGCHLLLWNVCFMRTLLRSTYSERILVFTATARSWVYRLPHFFMTVWWRWWCWCVYFIQFISVLSSLNRILIQFCWSVVRETKSIFVYPKYIIWTRNCFFLRLLVSHCERLCPSFELKSIPNLWICNLQRKTKTEWWLCHCYCQQSWWWAR